MRPHLEFAVSAWSPWLATDIEVLEKVQKRAIGMVSGITGTYEQKLKELKLLSLAQRRELYDLVQTFKIVRKIDNVQSETWFELVGTNPVRLTRYSNCSLNIIPKRVNLDPYRNFFFQQSCI